MEEYNRKIGFVLPSLANRGPVIVARNLANGLYRRGYDVRVHYMDDLGGDGFECPVSRLSQTAQESFDSYDILHSHGYRPDKLLAGLRPRFGRARIVATVHSDIKTDLSFTYNPLVSALFTPLWLRRLKKFDRVVCISHVLANIYKGRLTNMSTVHNGVTISPDLDQADLNTVARIKALKAISRGKLIGAYASLTKVKGLKQVILALQDLSEWSFVVMGDGPEKEPLQELARKCGVNERVLFLPYTEAPYNYLPLFSIYAMPSYSEGFGLALVEASLAKVPVVCSDIPVFRELFDENEVSYFTPDNRQAFLKAVARAFENGKSLADSAFKRSVASYSVSAMVDGYEAIYTKLYDR